MGQFTDVIFANGRHTTPQSGRRRACARVRWIQDFFHQPRHAMDFINEQHVALLQVDHPCRHVTGALDCRSLGLTKVHAQLAGDYVRQRGLAQPWRT